MRVQQKHTQEKWHRTISATCEGTGTGWKVSTTQMDFSSRLLEGFTDPEAATTWSWCICVLKHGYPWRTKHGNFWQMSGDVLWVFVIRSCLFGMICKANCARQLLIRNAKAREDGQQLLPDHSTSWDRFTTESSHQQHQPTGPSHPDSRSLSFGSRVFRFRAQQESTTDHFVAFVGKRNSLGIGMPPCFLGHP